MKPSIFDSAHPFFPWLILSNVLLTTFLALLSAAATMVGGSSIQGELALNNPQTQWVTTFYLLGVNSAVPAANWFGYRFGYRKIYAIGVLIFAVGSGLAGTATDFFLMAFSRLIEGIGAGLLFPVGLAMIVRNMPKEKLTLALNLYIAVGFGGGLGLGLPLCGYCIEFLSWRYVFFGVFFLSLLAVLECWASREKAPPRTEKPKFDLSGYLFFILFIASLLTALSFGALPSTDEGWRSPFILGCFALALIGIVSTFLIERKAEHPILPLKLFKDPLFSVSALTLFLLGMALFSSIATTADFMLKAMKYEKYVTGLIGSMYGLSMAVASIAANFLIKKVPVPVLALSGLTLLVISYFINNQITFQSAPPQVLLILFLRGCGVGLSFGPITGMGMHKVPKELTGEAATLLTFFRQVGGTYGGTIIGILTIKRTIFHAARYSEQVNPQIPGYRYTWNKLHTKAFSDLSDNALLSAKQAKLAIAQNIETQAYIQGLNDALFVFGCVTLAIGLLLLVLMVREAIRAKREEKSLS
jgi:DHA2 family multidrug resistance protein